MACKVRIIYLTIKIMQTLDGSKHYIERNNEKKKTEMRRHICKKSCQPIGISFLWTMLSYVIMNERIKIMNRYFWYLQKSFEETKQHNVISKSKIFRINFLLL